MAPDRRRAITSKWRPFRPISEFHSLRNHCKRSSRGNFCDEPQTNCVQPWPWHRTRNSVLVVAHSTTRPNHFIRLESSGASSVFTDLIYGSQIFTIIESEAKEAVAAAASATNGARSVGRISHRQSKVKRKICERVLMYELELCSSAHTRPQLALPPAVPLKAARFIGAPLGKVFLNWETAKNLPILSH